MAQLVCSMVVVLASVPPSLAQEAESDARDNDVTWTVQVDPLTTVLGIAHIYIERRISDHLAAYAGPSMRLYDSPLTADDEEGYKAYGVEMGVRYFFQGTAPTGWWAGARATIAHMTFGDDTRVGGYASALGGYAWVFGDRWVLSGALGISYFEYDVGGVGGVGVRGVRPGAHTAFGVAF
jgi:hypothetical protein